MTYTINIGNSSANVVNNVTVSDDLGTYTVGETQVTATPLTYTGPATLYKNGDYVSDITPNTSVAGKITFTIDTIEANSNAQINYKVVPNEYAPLTEGASITNTVTAIGTGLAESVSDSMTITAKAEADLRITKTMSPNNLTEGDTVTYRFDLYNYGNQAAETVVLSDTFSPAPTITDVVVDDKQLTPSAFTYANRTLTVPNSAGNAITVPAAEFTQNAAGLVTVTPGTAVITVVGRI